MSLRLDKYISEYGNYSRKEAKELLKKGRVTCNGICIKDGSLKVELTDEILVGEMQIIADTGYHYYVLNKPAGVITATKDHHDPCVLDLLPAEIRKGLSPVGRLDKDTTGLLVLTDDGMMLHRLLSPKYHVNKTYLAEVEKELKESDITKFSDGLDIGDEKLTRPAKLEILGPYTAKITICEGRYHQVKRMFEAVDNRVLTLKRLSMGDFFLPEELGEGMFREMTHSEVERLNVSK